MITAINDIRTNEERFRTIIQNISGYIYSVDYTDGAAVSAYHSPRCLEITGYSPEEYTRDPQLWSVMIHPDDRKRVLHIFNNLSRETSQATVEHRIFRKDGSTAWLSNTFSVQFDDDGKLQRMDGYISDITERKQAEEELAGQNEFMQNLIDSIPVPVFYKGTDGKYLGCNQTFCEYVGMPKEEIKGKTTYNVSPPELAAQYAEKDSLLFQQPGVQVYTGDFMHADGTLRHARFHKATYKGKDGAVQGVVGVIMDVSELERAERKLTATIDMLQGLENIIARGPAIVFKWANAPGWPVEFVSSNINLLGYPPEQLLSGALTYAELIHTADRQRIANEITHYTHEGVEQFVQEYRLKTGSGKHIWVEDYTWVQKNPAGSITHFLGIVVDISKRKRAQLMFRESEERYRTFTENTSDLICEINSKLRFMYLSPTFTVSLGYNPAELLNTSLLQLIHPEDIGPLKREMKKEQGQITHRFRAKNGTWLWFESAGKKFRTAHGEIRGVVVSRDISQRRKLEQQLIRTEKLMAVGEMSAMIVHEFRNSLTSIKMILQLARDAAAVKAAEKKSFVVALNSIYHMEDVLKQLLSFTKTEATEPVLYDINLLVEECLPMLEFQARKKDVRFSKKLGDHLPLLQLHPASIREVILNLLLNAIQAFDQNVMKVHRKITITTQRVILGEALRDIPVSSSNEYFKVLRNTESKGQILLPKNSECVQTVIMDNGSGIDPEHLPHILEPFFTTKEKGSGLGLAIVKRIVNAHDGILTVESRKGSGTAMKIWLPVPPAVTNTPPTT